MYIVITGINTLSRRLVDRLEGRHDVVVIEEDEDKCERLYSSSGATVINKAPSTLSALEDAGITQADVLISTQKDDNENMVVCSLGKKYGVPKVVSRMEDDEYFEAFQIIDAQAIGHTDLLLSEFLSAVEHPYLVKLANLSGDREVLKASIKDDSSLRGKTIKQMKHRKKFPNEFLVTSIIKEEDTMNAEPETEIEEEDSIILIGPQDEKEKLDKFFQNQ
ncbi:potassium channel family protein [Candidatus Nanohalobium constans]|uniref:Trk-type K+ transport system, NAD-binding component n=1 Tax=Candidatus Nanohalobium constans TaxID=2565781 RepID=A0A5Q0UGH3_9ARCH|nr:NAD-binding protein [Candidatus Nanohalobium constans]QGA80676.1 Trk-type K+ transport system, NAD-binding component [Candidatus Nanohalobium constans]